MTSVGSDHHHGNDDRKGSFLDFKLKRRRVSEIVSSVESELTVAFDLEVHSNMSSESGYGSQSEGTPTRVPVLISKGNQKLSNGEEDLNGNGFIFGMENLDGITKAHIAKMKMPQFGNQLVMPPVHSRADGTPTNMHMGVAYLGLMKNVAQQGLQDGKDLKMGLIPIVSSKKGMIPLTTQGLSACTGSDMPKGVQPLFFTSMPNGFMVKPNDTSSENGKKSHQMESTLGKHKLSQPDSKPCKKFLTKESESEFIEHYTNGMFEYLGHLGRSQSSHACYVSKSGSSFDTERKSVTKENIADLTYDNKYPMVCGICNDRATGLHYGIITCEGCKGFFKRTVQNRRVYTCAGSDGECEINKTQRNRCQYCRFKKCLQAGMVLAAVREDRMPGGRNSGEVYNLYKVKYKKHRRRDETKVSKEKVAYIHRQDHQIKVEPVRSHVRYENVLHVPHYGASRPGGNRAMSVGFLGSHVSYSSNGLTNDYTPLSQMHMDTMGPCMTSSTDNRYQGRAQSMDTDLLVSSGLYPRMDPRIRNNDIDLQSWYNAGHIASDSACAMQGDFISASLRYQKDTPSQQSFNEDIQQRKLELFENTLYGYKPNNNQSSDSQSSENAFTYFVNNIQERNEEKSEKALFPISNTCNKCSHDKTRFCRCSNSQKEDHHSVLRHTLTCPEEEAEKLFAQSSSQITSCLTDKQSQKLFLTSESLSSPIPLIGDLMRCDMKLKVTELYNIPELMDKKNEDVTKILCDLGDKVVGKLVQWTKTLPFFKEIPIEVHSELLSNRWQELLLLITTAHRAIYGTKEETMSLEGMYSYNMGKLQYYLEHLFKREFTESKLDAELGEIMRHITTLMQAFVNMNLTLQEYVCLQVILLLNQGEDSEVEVVSKLQDRYCIALKEFVNETSPGQLKRFSKLIQCLPQVQTAAALLMNSKMIYIPFFLNS
ncbi:hormone receptor 4-like [Mya arenaria]|uniref:hormone receptor 4-like n=1 Tax=Mya arenaria TaxID=6604 RepID=UPI0022E86A60|nr:hormone receptor 4-like [Mya arenaria]